MKTLSPLLTALRPEQWIKNAFVLIPLVFAEQLLHFQSIDFSFGKIWGFCSYGK